jgi:hypothetical protein
MRRGGASGANGRAIDGSVRVPRALAATLGADVCHLMVAEQP